MSELKNRRYLKTVSNWKQVHDFPCNTSTSKQLWTIPKEVRFQKSNTQRFLNDKFYDVNSKWYRSQ